MCSCKLYKFISRCAEPVYMCINTHLSLQVAAYTQMFNVVQLHLHPIPPSSPPPPPPTQHQQQHDRQMHMHHRCRHVAHLDGFSCTSTPPSKLVSALLTATNSASMATMNPGRGASRGNSSGLNVRRPRQEGPCGGHQHRILSRQRGYFVYGTNLK